MRPSGISLGFPRLSPSHGQLDYVLLARPPLYSSCDFHVRLACLSHTANVRSEPESNPSLSFFCLHLESGCAAPSSAGRQPYYCSHGFKGHPCFQRARVTAVAVAPAGLASGRQPRSFAASRLLRGSSPFGFGARRSLRRCRSRVVGRRDISGGRQDFNALLGFFRSTSSRRP